SLKRPGDTHWSSHYDTLINLVILFSSVGDVLEIIGEDELNTRVNEVNTEFLCMACLNPSDLFSAFDREKLIHFAKFYASGFSLFEIEVLDSQLDTYINDMHSYDKCSKLKGIGDLAKKLVELKKDIVYPLVYKLVKFALILLVTTATIERVFSTMNIVKNQLRNRIGDE
ncbi:Dimer_Tnp_hAT domain-containing protein, partial [Cephalotus follicularis]